MYWYELIFIMNMMTVQWYPILIIILLSESEIATHHHLLHILGMPKVLVEAHTHSQIKGAIYYMWVDTFFMQSFSLHHSIFLLHFFSCNPLSKSATFNLYVYCEMLTWKTKAKEYDMLIAVAFHDGETSSRYGEWEWKWRFASRLYKCAGFIRLSFMVKTLIV